MTNKKTPTTNKTSLLGVYAWLYTIWKRLFFRNACTKNNWESNTYYLFMIMLSRTFNTKKKQVEQDFLRRSSQENGENSRRWIFSYLINLNAATWILQSRGGVRQVLPFKIKVLKMKKLSIFAFLGLLAFAAAFPSQSNSFNQNVWSDIEWIIFKFSC